MAAPRLVRAPAPDATIVVRMAVLFELLAGRSAPQPALSTPVPA